MMPMRKGLFAIAIHDAALFHTFLAHYVASYDLRFGTGDPAESLQHRTEAMRIINERLQNPYQALTDVTIAAVANIAIYEVSSAPRWGVLMLSRNKYSLQTDQRKACKCI
jgi:hypothetical protein